MLKKKPYVAYLRRHYCLIVVIVLLNRGAYFAQISTVLDAWGSWWVSTLTYPN